MPDNKLYGNWTYEDLVNALKAESEKRSKKFTEEEDNQEKELARLIQDMENKVQYGRK